MWEERGGAGGYAAQEPAVMVAEKLYSHSLSPTMNSCQGAVEMAHRGGGRTVCLRLCVAASRGAKPASAQQKNRT